ncbi:Dedicator of cytokinesis protein 1 [Golovinomyces cichoracearum]|uniref:Dedicator of cytokinesis protein 1 n=1 Tax=Golovinomyces cichoracearum TaxID=62708 RepID=A0A420I2L2_9PEZI|nr:Dedicator of cytokinesis protein 1 [Golovinomyces cichoracearum]
MPWQPLPQIAFAVAIYPFVAQEQADLPLELGDELYIIEQGGKNGDWFRGYLLAPPSLLTGLTSFRGQTLEARVFSGIFPRSCVEVREILNDGELVDLELNLPNLSFDSDNAVVDIPKDIKHHSLAKFKTSVRLRESSKRRTWKRKSINGRFLYEQVIRDPATSKPPAPVPMLKIGDETPTCIEEPLVDEIASCMREWQSTHLHRLLLAGEYQLLNKMAFLVQNLYVARKQLLYGFLTKHELTRLQEKVVWDLVQGNKLFAGEVIVRDPLERGKIMTADDSIIEVTRLQSMMSLLDEQPKLTIQEKPRLYHLLAEIKTFVGTSTENSILIIFLASKAPGTPYTALSENFIIEVPPTGALTSLVKTESMRTLFTNLTSVDIGEASAAENNLYLVVKLQTLQHISESRSREKNFSPDGNSNGNIPLAASHLSKAGLKNMMWGSKVQKNTFSRHLTSTSKNSNFSDSPSPSRDGSSHTTKASNFNNDERKIVPRTFRKTIKIGALKLNEIMKRRDECEQIMNMWAPEPEYNENIVDNLEEVIRESNNFENSRRSERLHLNFKAFNFSDSDALVEATPTLLTRIVTTNKMEFSGAPTKPRSDVYLTIHEALLSRQTFLTRISGLAGSFIPLSQNMIGQNFQITMEVRDSNSERIPGCIFPSSNSAPQSTWESSVVTRGEPWKQSLRLNIPISSVPTCHLFLTISDAPNDPFAFCYLPLWNEQAFVSNGHHNLILYGYDENVKISKENEEKASYLIHPWNSRGNIDSSKNEAVTRPAATLRVQTSLCSTFFLQDKILIGLLKWKEISPAEVKEILKRLVFVPEIEIVKLLNDVFSAIFGILVEQAGDEDYEDLIFSALVTILGIIHDRRFNLGPLFDQYAESLFHFPFATSCLVRPLTRLLAKPSDPNASRQLRATFKVVKYILRFISQAREQQMEKEAGIGIMTTIPSFTKNMRSIFKALDQMMRSESPILIGSKTLAVQHFHTWLPELNNLLTKEEILHIAIDFMDSCSSVKGKLILYKLVLIINYSKLNLFSEKSQRKALCMNTVRWISPFWNKNNDDDDEDQWRDQVRLCCSIVASQIYDLANEIPDYIPKIVSSYSQMLEASRSSNSEKMRFSLLFPTIYPFPSKNLSCPSNVDEALVELSGVLSAISMRPAGIQLELAADEMARLLENTLNVHFSILQCEAFPASWLSVHIYHHKSTMKTLEYIYGILLENFIPDPDEAENYNTELWKAFFTVLLKLIGSDILALETFPEQKRRAVWKIAGDIREAGADLMRMAWHSIGWETSLEERCRYGLARMGGYQVQYVPCLVGPIVELCLSVHESLRKVAVEVLHTIIVSEWTLSEDIYVIQAEVIDYLDRLFKSKTLTESILQKLFIAELEILFAPLSKIQGDPLYVAVRELISKTSEFLDLLVAVYGSEAAGEAASKVSRLQLMEFLRDMQKEEILIRYVHQLAQLQLDAGNIAEAGYSLRLHAELYDWDPTRIAPALSDPQFEAQSHFDRKERIYFDMIKLLEDGGAWSSALSAYQELQLQYQENVYDYSKLAQTQQCIGSIYEKLLKSGSSIPKYFRVVYKGLGFPPSVRDQEFVFEVHPNEKQASFLDRMQAAHPAAQIVTTEDIQEFEGQYILVNLVSPHRNLEHPVLQRTRVAQPVKDYLLSSFPQKFSVTLKRNISGPITEHTAEKIIYKTVDQFPTILRCSRIESVTREVMGALETGLERVIRKTAEMTATEKRVAKGENKMAPLLIKALKISVDPHSDSAISQYRSLIPEDSDEKGNKAIDLVQSLLGNALKSALIDFAIMIRRCLVMFSEPQKEFLLSDEEKESITQNFETVFAPELVSYAYSQQLSIFAQMETGLKPPWSLSFPTPSCDAGIDLAPLPTSSTDYSATTRHGKKRLNFFNKIHERLEDNNFQSEFVSMGSTARILNPVTSYNASLRNSREKSRNSIRSGHGLYSGDKNDSPRHSQSKDGSTVVSDKDYIAGKRKSFIFSSARSRVANRSESRQKEDNDVASNDHSRAGSVKYHHYSYHQQDANSDMSRGSSPLSTKGGFGRVAGEVKKRLSLAGLGIVRKKGFDKFAGKVATEES